MRFLKEINDDADVTSIGRLFQSLTVFLQKRVLIKVCFLTGSNKIVIITRREKINTRTLNFNFKI